MDDWMNGPHEHECRICKRRFECLQMTHCTKRSTDPDFARRPICYRDECRVAREVVLTREKELRDDH